MNSQDRKEFELIHLKIDTLTDSLADLKVEMNQAHQKTDESLRFIKDNLFDPHKGLWAETKVNSLFRVSSMKWRGIVGTGFVGLFFKQIWDLFSN
jgi:hypothetical protein